MEVALEYTLSIKKSTAGSIVAYLKEYFRLQILNRLQNKLKECPLKILTSLPTKNKFFLLLWVYMLNTFHNTIKSSPHRLERSFFLQEIFIGNYIS